MFGYVTIRKPELKVKDYETYHSFYCGLCYRLKEKYGFLGQVTLTYDMTFLVILLASVYDEKIVEQNKHCVVHPVKKHRMRYSKATDYGADMNILLSFLHFQDDWVDERSVTGAVGTIAYKRICQKLKKKYKRQYGRIQKALHELSLYEKENSQDVKKVASCTGKLMAALAAYREDPFAKMLQKCCFHLGRYIYIMDAYEDYEKDAKKGCYNPLRELAKGHDYEARIETLLYDEMAEAAASFEQLPCMEYVDILRNILYAGVWNRYDILQSRKKTATIEE